MVGVNSILKKFQFSKLVSVHVVGQFYPWFNFYFSLFFTHYHTLPYTKTKKKKIGPRIKLNHNIDPLSTLLFMLNERDTGHSF